MMFLSTPKAIGDSSKPPKERISGWCESRVSAEYKFIAVVDATMYHPVPGQTDSTPDIVADGTKFDIPSAGELSWIAVSRDLHTRWGGPLHFGDIVYISSAREKSGFYLVKDTMNKRFTNRIDFLESPGTDIYRYEKAVLHLVWSDEYSSELLWALNSNQNIIQPTDEQFYSKTTKKASQEERFTL